MTWKSEPGERPKTDRESGGGTGRLREGMGGRVIFEVAGVEEN